MIMRLMRSTSILDMTETTTRVLNSFKHNYNRYRDSYSILYKDYWQTHIFRIIDFVDHYIRFEYEKLSINFL